LDEGYGKDAPHAEGLQSEITCLVFAQLDLGIQFLGRCRTWRFIFRLRTSVNGYPNGILPVAEGEYAARLR